MCGRITRNGRRALIVSLLARSPQRTGHSVALKHVLQGIACSAVKFRVSGSCWAAILDTRKCAEIYNSNA